MGPNGIESQQARDTMGCQNNSDNTNCCVQGCTRRHDVERDSRSMG